MSQHHPYARELAANDTVAAAHEEESIRRSHGDLQPLTENFVVGPQEQDRVAAAPRESKSQKRRRSESTKTDAEGQADKRLKSQKGGSIPFSCPFRTIGREQDTCKTQHQHFSHLCQHLKRTHNFRSGPPQSAAKRFQWLALFDVDNAYEQQISPIFCLTCGTSFSKRQLWVVHTKRSCIGSRLSRADITKEIKSAFFEFVRVDAQRCSNSGEVPDAAKISLSPQTLGELWRTRDQVVTAMDSMGNLVSNSVDRSKEDQRILRLLRDTKNKFLRVIEEIERR